MSRCGRTLVALSTLLLSGPAWAGVVGLTPFVAGKGVSEETVMDLFSLVSSELEFMEGVDEVIEIEPAPPALDLGCLDSTNCLGAIAYDVEADHLVAGGVEKLGNNLLLDILYYDGSVNRVLRRKTFELPDRATELVDAITPVLVETVTGRSPTAEKEAEMDDVSFDAPPPDLDTPEEPPPAVVEDPPPAEDFDPSAISFGSSPDDISFGAGEVAYVEDESDPDPDPEYEDEEPDDDDRIRPPPPREERRPRPSFEEPSSRSTKSREEGPNKDFRRVHISVRGGYTNYGVFHFVTGGAELKVHTVSGLYVTLGVDAHIVRREKAPQLVASEGCSVAVDDTGRCVEPGFIFPLNGGILYHFKGGKFQPYLGADMIAAQYFREPDDLENGIRGRNKWTFGARARLGADILVTNNFGFNLDVALGFWLGEDWPQVDPRLRQIGFAPHVGAGLVFAF
jgi:hypothetical protein